MKADYITYYDKHEEDYKVKTFSALDLKSQFLREDICHSRANNSYRVNVYFV